MIGLYMQSRIHSLPAFGVYAIGNIGLTVLQLKWLGEIFMGIKETFAPSSVVGKDDAAIADGSAKKKDISKKQK